MTYDDFIALVGQESTKNHEMRYGQVWYNMLSSYRADLAHRVTATPLDPFYRDVVSVEIHDFVRSQW